MAEDMHGRWCVVGGACIAGVVHGLACVWQGTCVAGGMCGRRVCVAGNMCGKWACMAGGMHGRKKAIAADTMHPTGMHFYFNFFNLISSIRLTF